MTKTLWHDRYEENWLRAFPVGNGRVAAMVYGGPETEILQLNEESLWSGRQIREEYHSTPEVLQEIRTHLLNKRIHEAFSLCEKHLLCNPPMVRHYQTFGEIRIAFADSAESLAISTISSVVGLITGSSSTFIVVPVQPSQPLELYS